MLIRSQPWKLAAVALLLVVISACTAQPEAPPTSAAVKVTDSPTATATLTPQPSQTPTPSPTAMSTLTPSPTATATPTAEPTPEGQLALLADPRGDGSVLADGSACLPDHMDFVTATLMLAEDGSLKVSLVMSDTIPTEGVERGNAGYDMLVYFGEQKPSADTAFRLLPMNGVYTPLYAPPGDRTMAPDPGFTVEFEGPELLIRIAPDLREVWPETILVRLSTFLCPAGGDGCCGDALPDARDVVSITIP